MRVLNEIDIKVAAIIMVLLFLVWLHGWLYGQRRYKYDNTQTKLGDNKQLDTVVQAINNIQREMSDIERRRIVAEQELLLSVKDTGSAAHKLGHALQVPHVRGRWGEMHLRRAVELAGMLEHCDFSLQQSYYTEENKLRPDMVVHLSEGRSIVVDAKAPLAAWNQAITCEDEVQKTRYEKQHALCVKEHVRALSARGYHSAIPKSIAFTILYLPGEDLLRAACEQDTELLEFAAQKDIILATPTSLISILRGASLGWREHTLAHNAQQIAALGAQLYKRIAVVLEHFSRLGKALNSSVESFDSTVASMQSRLLPTARGLSELNAFSASELEEPVAIDRATRNVEVV